MSGDTRKKPFDHFSVFQELRKLMAQDARAQVDYQILGPKAYKILKQKAYRAKYYKRTGK